MCNECIANNVRINMSISLQRTNMSSYLSLSDGLPTVSSGVSTPTVNDTAETALQSQRAQIDTQIWLTQHIFLLTLLESFVLRLSN